MDEFMVWLVSWFAGMDGWVVLLLIVFFISLHLAVKAEAPRRDSRRRNQAHRLK